VLPAFAIHTCRTDDLMRSETLTINLNHYPAIEPVDDIRFQRGWQRTGAPSPAGLILEAPHVFVEDITVSSIAQARVRYNETDMPQRLGRYHASPDSLFRAWSDIWLDPGFRSWNIESFLGSIRRPVLVLQGAEDEYGTSEQVAAIQDGIPSASIIVLDNCKHAPHRDRCDATLSAIGQFLRSSEDRDFTGGES
jgi:pimeloyl-ACP methyl ester carboxylesterase